ncbi:hypothetical protein LUZ60_016981 [Juncus effusus]|nr:hypothetical protein LUZ60_016981 [Juncus effusus]
MVKKVERGIVGNKKFGVNKNKEVVNRGAWTEEEDKRLMEYVRIHGDKKWRTLPSKAGLNRCGKSCRLRWLNYLRPGIKRGNISQDEEDLILRLHNLLGNRWSIIAARLPGRTDNEIKNHWNTHLSKKPLTIDDLNLKINQQSDENKEYHFTETSHESTPNLINGGKQQKPNANTILPDLSAELSGLDMEFDQFFDFSTMPPIEIDKINSGSSSSNDLGVEDYGITGWDNDGCLDSSFIETDQFIDCQDYALCFLD